MRKGTSFFVIFFAIPHNFAVEKVVYTMPSIESSKTGPSIRLEQEVAAPRINAARQVIDISAVSRIALIFTVKPPTSRWPRATMVGCRPTRSPSSREFHLWKG